jgi:uncharacterized protein
MKQFNLKVLANLTFAIFTCILLLTPLFALDVYASPEDQKVYDFSGLFSDQEVSELEGIFKKYGVEGLIDIVAITVDSLDSITRKKYLEDFYDEYGFGYDKEFGDAVLLLINMDPADRGVEIQGYGMAEYYVNNDRIEYMLDDITELLKSGDYYEAMEEYAKQAAYYMNQEKGVKVEPATGDQNTGNGYGESSYDGPSDYYGEKEDNIFYNTLVQLGIALAIGGISVGVMAANSGGRITVHNRTYLNEGTSGVVDSRDDYIRTTTTKVRKPQNNNNGGGRSSGGGGISSGGNSHSGGGRGF